MVFCGFDFRDLFLLFDFDDLLVEWNFYVFRLVRGMIGGVFVSTFWKLIRFDF